MCRWSLLYVVTFVASAYVTRKESVIAYNEAKADMMAAKLGIDMVTENFQMVQTIASLQKSILFTSMAGLRFTSQINEGIMDEMLAQRDVYRQRARLITSTFYQEKIGAVEGKNQQTESSISKLRLQLRTKLIHSLQNANHKVDMISFQTAAAKQKEVRDAASAMLLQKQLSELQAGGTMVKMSLSASAYKNFFLDAVDQVVRAIKWEGMMLREKDKIELATTFMDGLYMATEGKALSEMISIVGNKRSAPKIKLSHETNDYERRVTVRNKRLNQATEIIKASTRLLDGQLDRARDATVRFSQSTGAVEVQAKLFSSGPDTRDPFSVALRTVEALDASRQGVMNDPSAASLMEINAANIDQRCKDPVARAAISEGLLEETSDMGPLIGRIVAAQREVVLQAIKIGGERVHLEAIEAILNRQ